MLIYFVAGNVVNNRGGSSLQSRGEHNVHQSVGVQVAGQTGSSVGFAFGRRSRLSFWVSVYLCHISSSAMRKIIKRTCKTRSVKSDLGGLVLRARRFQLTSLVLQSRAFRTFCNATLFAPYSHYTAVCEQKSYESFILIDYTH